MVADPDLPLDQRDRHAAEASFDAAADSIRLVDDLLVLINHGTAVFDGHRHDRGLNFLISLISVRAFNSLWRGRQCAVDGYAVQAMTLARAALEDWIAVRWLEEKPEKANLWLGHMLEGVEVPRDARGREEWLPSADKMLIDLPERDGVRAAYEALSRVAHPRGSGLGWQFHADAEALLVHAGPNVDPRDLRRVLFFLVHIGAGFLPCVEHLQERWLGGVDEEWRTRSIAAVERAQLFLRAVADEVVLPGQD